MAQIQNYSSSQDLSNGFKENWADALKQLLGQYNVSASLCGKEANAALSANTGDSYNYLTVSEQAAGDIDPYVEQTAVDATITVDQMVLNLTSEYTFRQEEDEKGLAQTYESFFARQSEAALKAHNKDIDGNFFAVAFQNTSYVYDAEDLTGGAAGAAITVTSSNIDEISFNSQALISEQAQEGGNISIVLPPRGIAALGTSAYGNGSNVSDSAYRGGLTSQLNNGRVGSFFGVDYYQSLFLPHFYELTYTGQPADTQTVVVKGVTITFVASLTGGNNEVLIGADEDATYTNLVALLNNSSGSTATYKGSAINSANQKVLRTLAGKLNTTDGIVDIISKTGRFATAPTETANNATIGATQLAQALVTLYGAVELADPRGVRFSQGKNDFGTTMNYSSRVRYGVATPTNNKQRYGTIRITA